MPGMPDDVLRKLANLIRFGTVQAVAGKRVQVKIGGLLAMGKAYGGFLGSSSGRPGLNPGNLV